MNNNEHNSMDPSQEKSGKTLKYLLGFVVVVVVLGGSWYIANAPKTSQEDLISKQGIHWHPNLTITIKGEEQLIPGDIGMGGVNHEGIHTHKPSDVDTLHIEKSGIVKKENVRLAEFFKIWGKKLTKECIFEFCNGEDGQLKMLVNGEENTEFDDYLMQDKDEIEIIFE
jgi:hypothetical protein